MTHCLFHQGVQALTADLHVRFAHSIPCDAYLRLWAEVTLVKAPLYHVRAEISLNGRLMAWSQGKFVIRSSESTVLGV